MQRLATTYYPQDKVLLRQWLGVQGVPEAATADLEDAVVNGYDDGSFKAEIPSLGNFTVECAPPMSLPV